MELSPFEIIKNSIDNHNLFKKKDTLVVSFSGGPDSVFLMKTLEKLHAGRLIYIHFVHGIRLGDEKREAALLKKIESKNNIEIITRRLPTKSYAKKHSVSIEHAGRLLRHSFLIHFLKLKKANHVITGHHFDDHIETYLLKKKRGSRYPIGLKFKTLIYNKSFIKPLLDINKQTILKTLNSNKDTYITDPSNDDLIYERNIIRHSKKQSQKETKLILNDIHTNTVTIKKLNESTTRLISKIKTINNTFSISTIPLEKIDQDTCKFFINAFIHTVFSRNQTKGNLLIPSSIHSSKHIDCIYKALKKHETDQRLFKLNLPTFYTVQIKKKTVTIFSEKLIQKSQALEKIKNKIEPYLSINLDTLTKTRTSSTYHFKDYQIKIDLTKTAPLTNKPLHRLETRTSLLTSNNPYTHNKLNLTDYSNLTVNDSITFYDFDIIEDKQLIVRTRNSKEKIKLFNGPTKPLKKYFIDAKIPQEIRQSVPLFFIENTLVWIGGFQRSNHYKITKSTKQILKIELKRKTITN